MRVINYPFTAILGQEQLKQALLLNAIDPKIGGALIRGEKGTAKSTAVRALASLLPPIAAIEGCPLHCAPDDPAVDCTWCDDRDASVGLGTESGSQRGTMMPVPLVELPVAATEDRVAGSFNLEDAIQRGTRRFEPGLLAAANRGILYVDEVNLLPDHLVDTILDAAAAGTHRVEREGISVMHPARFVLVGTMNPEEGDLRPQLLDRFGLAAAVTTPRNPAERAEIVRRRIAFDAHPETFTSSWETAEQALREQIARARALAPAVQVEDVLIDLIARICVAYEVDGLRADIVIYRAAAATAALAGRTVVTAEDVRMAALLALPHRRRRPFDDGSKDTEPLDRLVQEFQEQNPSPARPADSPEGSTGDGEGGLPVEPATPHQPWPSGASNVASRADRWADSSDVPDQTPSSPPTVSNGQPKNTSPRSHTSLAPAGDQRTTALPVDLPVQIASLLRPVLPAQRTGQTPFRGVRRAPRDRHAGQQVQGPHVRSIVPRGRPVGLAWDATLRAAAPFQVHRRKQGSERDDRAVHLYGEDLREPVRAGKRGALILFVVDSSGSMGARGRMAFAKGAVRALLTDAYRRRDRVGLITFRGQDARLVLPPTRSVTLADRFLAETPTGGRTPLAAALYLAALTLERHASLGRGTGYPLLVLVSDGKANVPHRGSDPWADALAAAKCLKQSDIPSILVDTDASAISLGLSEQLAEALGAQIVRLSGYASGRSEGVPARSRSTLAAASSARAR